MRNWGKRLQQLLFLLFLCSFCLLSYLFVRHYAPKGVLAWVCVFVGVGLGASLVVFLHPVVHELGHVVFGKFVRLKLISFRAGCICFEQGKLRFSTFTAGGECVMLPTAEQGVTSKRRTYAWGGIVGSLVFVLPFLWAPFSLRLPAPVYAGLSTAALCALYELISNIFPSEGREKTDGEVLFSSYKRTPVSVVEDAVFAAQSYLCLGKTPAEIPAELLYGLPVISEGEQAFALLTHLRLLRALLLWDKGEIHTQLARAEDIYEDLQEPAYRALLSEMVFAFSVTGNAEKAETYYLKIAGEDPWMIPARHRAEFAYLFCVEGDKQGAEKAAGHAKKLAQGLLLSGERITEDGLIALVK